MQRNGKAGKAPANPRAHRFQHRFLTRPDLKERVGVCGAAQLRQFRNFPRRKEPFRNLRPPALGVDPFNVHTYLGGGRHPDHRPILRMRKVKERPTSQKRLSMLAIFKLRLGPRHLRKHPPQRPPCRQPPIPMDIEPEPRRPLLLSQRQRRRHRRRINRVQIKSPN